MKLLKTLYGIHSTSKAETDMIKFLCDWMKERGLTPTVDKSGNILVTKGVSDTYPCIVAHTDEVHRAHPDDFRVCQEDDVIYGFSPKKRGQFGIGADDKNGVWVALKALIHLKCVKVALFTGEEIGCIGSSAGDMTFFNDCRFVIQCDRRGGGDFIDNASGVPLCTKEFMHLMCAEDYGYKTAHGMMTDVMKLRSRGLKVCACNLSCGYYNPHSDDEVTVVPELKNCLAMVLNACRTIKEVQPMAVYEPPKITVYPTVRSYGSYDYGYGYGYGGSYNYRDGYKECRDDTTWRSPAASKLIDEREIAVAYGREWKIDAALDVMQTMCEPKTTPGVQKSFLQALALLKAVPDKYHRISLSQAYYQKLVSLNTLKLILSFIDLEYLRETQLGVF